MMYNSRPYHPAWGSFGCSLAWLKALTTAQLVLSIPCIASQVLFFIWYDYDWRCIVFPASVPSILFFLAASIGIAGLARRHKALIAAYLLFGSASILAAVILGFLSTTYIYDKFWGRLMEAFSVDVLLVWVLLLLCCLEVFFFLISCLVAGVALSRFDPAFKNKLLGFKTPKMQKTSSTQSIDTVKEELWVKTET